MRVSIILIILLFPLSLISQVKEKFDRLYLNEEYNILVDYFDNVYGDQDFKLIENEVLSYYVISKLKISSLKIDKSFSSLNKIEIRNIKNYVDLSSDRYSDILKYEFGKYQYNNSKYKSAVKYLSQTSEYADSNLMLGISYFNLKDFKEAKEYIDKIDSNNSNRNLLLGAIEYMENNYTNSLEYLNKIENNDPIYQKALQYKISSHYFLKNYSKSVELETFINDQTENKDYCHYYIAESFLKLKNYDKTLNNLLKLKNYIDRENDIKFKIAYSYYMLGLNEESKSYFKGLTDKKNNYSQKSFFYLGKIFQENDKINQAKNYFYAAYRENKDDLYTKNALLNYSKSNYIIGDYDLSIATLEKLKVEFPNFKLDEVNSLISENYFLTNNYDKIITYLSSLKTISKLDRNKFQFITYQRGVREFNKGNFKNSIKYFNLSSRYNVNNDIYIKSLINKSEALFIGNKYNESKNVLLTLLKYKPIPEKLLLKAHLSLAYTYYNLNEYEEASKYFKIYVDRELKNKNEEIFNSDTYLRLADSYYASKNFKKAIESYKKISEKKSDKNYLNYQIGLSYNGINRNNQSIEFLDKVINEGKNSLVDDALFRKAQIYLESSEFDNSILTQNKLIQFHPYSNYLPYAYLNRATCYFNLKAYDQSEADYLYILKNIMDEKIQNEALLGYQKVVSFTKNYSVLNESISNFRKKFPNNNIKKLQYENLRNLYFNQQYKEFINLMLSVDSMNEEVFNRYEIDYYLAESYYKSNNMNKANIIYKKLLDSMNSKYFSRSLNRVANIYLKQQDYNNSLIYYKKLESNFKNNREKIESFIGILSNYFYLKNYDSVQLYSTRIGQIENISFNNRNKINLLKAKSFLQNENKTAAIDMLINTINLVQDESAAEASYILAEIFFTEGKKMQALETLYTLNENFNTYENWVGNSYLLIAKIFISMNETFQAKATLESLIDNTEIEEIKASAINILNKIEDD